MERLRRFRESSQRQVELSAIGDAVAEIADDFGLKKYAYFAVPYWPRGIEDYCLMSSYPREWTDHYIANEFERVDPVIRTAMTSLLPFFWGPGEHIEPKTSKEKKLFREAKEFEIEFGWTVPIHDAMGRIGSLNFCCGGDLDEFRAIIQQNQHELHLIAIYLHSAVGNQDIKPLSLQRFPLLSTREIECLEWASRGKSRRDTAAILGVSPATVKFHLENAIRKLEVATTRQACVKAALMGLIGAKT